MLNQVVLMGRLTADPELRTTASGVEVCSFQLAVDRDFVAQGQERQADFIPCTAWRQQASFLNRFFKKGNMVAVVGRLQSRNYEDKDGNRRTAYDVQVDRISFTGERTGNAGGAAAPAAAPRPESAAYSTAAPSDFEIISDDEDLPF